MNDNHIIRLQNIEKCYCDFNSNFFVQKLNKIPYIKLYSTKIPIKNLNLSIRQGDTIGITAPDRATINAFLNILTGHSLPTKGTMSVHRPVKIFSAICGNNKSSSSSIISNDTIPQDPPSAKPFAKTLANFLKNDTGSVLIFDEINLSSEALEDTKELSEVLMTKKRDTTVIFASLDVCGMQAFCSDVFNAQGTAPRKTALGEKTFLPLKGCAETYAHPIAIGGVGGSGTRLIAGMLQDVGIHIGNDLNRANDNLWFTLLFKQADLLEATKDAVYPRIDAFTCAMMGADVWEKEHVELVNKISSINRSYCTKYWLKLKACTLLKKNHRSDSNSVYTFGWKEPNTHLFIDLLKNKYPQMKYIHVCRNGLDMAHSENQNQVNLWGKYFIDGLTDISARESLKFWCLANKRALEICNIHNIDHLIVNYDNLCINTKEELLRISKFLDIDYALLKRYEKIIKKPKSIGRFRNYDINLFDENDLKYVKKLGFDIN